MTGFSSPVIPSSLDAGGSVSRNEPHDGQDAMIGGGGGAECAAPDYASRWASGTEPDEEYSPVSRSDDDNEELLRSFDMIFQLHQRTEDLRRRLEHIDKVLLTSRTVVGLLETVTETLEKDMDLVVARVLFREDHPIANTFEMDASSAMSTIPQPLVESESLFRGDPYILDDPSGELGEVLLGDAAPQVASAVVANLCTADEELGLLCLGSDDPHRYCGGMNTELIAAMADKIALGLQNAWDHEIRVRQALMGDVDGVYSEVFLKEYLKKEFQRSWRTYRTFSLMAVAWDLSYDTDGLRTHELVSSIKANLRAADVIAEGESVNLWVLFPDTNLEGARVAAARLVKCISENPGTGPQIFAGVTAFSRDAVTMHKLMRQAKIALAEAIESDRDRVVALPVELG